MNYLHHLRDVVGIGAVAAFAGCVFAIPALLPLARRIGLVDHPGGRKQHERPTPLIGGWAMVTGAACGMVVLDLTLGLTSSEIGLAVGALFLMVFGTLDDLFDLPWQARLVAQTAAALLVMTVGGVRLEHAGPIIGLGDIKLGWLAFPATLFAIVGVINAINMVDGVDGLAGSLVITALTLFFAAAWYSGADFIAILGVLIGAVAGFLIYNAPAPWRTHALTFMGNGGSEVLGLVVAWAAIRLTQNPAHAVSPLLAPFFVIVPLADCLVVTARRLRAGRSPFAAGRDHLHHLIADAGFGPTELIIAMCGLTFLIGAAAAEAYRLHAPKPLFAIAAIFILVAHFLFTTNHARTVNQLSALRRLFMGEPKLRQADQTHK